MQLSVVIKGSFYFFVYMMNNQCIPKLQKCLAEYTISSAYCGLIIELHYLQKYEYAFTICFGLCILSLLPVTNSQSLLCEIFHLALTHLAASVLIHKKYHHMNQILHTGVRFVKFNEG